MVMPNFLAECFACCLTIATMLLLGFMNAGTVFVSDLFRAHHIQFFAAAVMRINLDLVRAFVAKLV
jgi:hypothetical protein